MSASTKLRRVRFRHWTDYAIDLPAASGEEALSHAKLIYDRHGAAMFEDLDSGDHEWGVEDDRSVIADEFSWLLREIEGALP